jgi:hypothetical protein
MHHLPRTLQFHHHQQHIKQQSIQQKAHPVQVMHQMWKFSKEVHFPPRLEQIFGVSTVRFVVHIPKVDVFLPRMYCSYVQVVIKNIQPNVLLEKCSQLKIQN